MIWTGNGIFILQTGQTGYAFRTAQGGVLQHLYYGRRLPRTEDYLLAPVTLNQPGNALLDGGSCREDLLQEAGTAGWGDLRQSLVEVRLPDGGRACDFHFSHFERPASAAPEGLPAAVGGETLKVVLKERSHDVYLELYYTVFEETDVIVRWCRLVNDSAETVWVERLMSTQLDLPADDYDLITFRGAWAREMDLVRQNLEGQLCWSSSAGVSSNRCNPFAMVCRRDAGEEHGDVWALNLLYSGNHLGTAERSAYSAIRLTQGIGGLCWQLLPGSFFDTPQAVMTYSPQGFGGISRQMHPFVRRHIVRGYWQDRERPVLVNSWEALYFKVSARRVTQLARSAKEIGAELLVLDDGWFKGRSSDDRALGDWTADRKKLPDGLASLAKDVKAQGVDFGLWVEPEMVSENSDLFRAHPDWILGHRDQAIGRNQYVLDLTRPEVCRYVTETMRSLLYEADIRYIKWDMNRILGDTFTPSLPAVRQGEAAHRYVLGLYSILRELTEAFPQVLFESCASGGNRFDLGMLCYMPQIWASDNTDASCRARIQWGYSYGYPQSVLGCHVSDAPNHQTLRRTPLESRFSVAAIGLLGYEMDPGVLSADRRQRIREQIETYKARRRLFQFGQMYRCPCPDGETLTVTVAEDGSEAAAVHFVALNAANPAQHPLRLRGLAPEKTYRLANRPAEVRMKDFGSLVNYMAPIRIRAGSLVESVADRVVKLPADQLELTASGAALCAGGFWPVQPFGGTGFNEGTRLMKDFDSRLYFLSEVEG
ncbi:MAG: alpha-galactosidase [Ruminococcaceae bacterium]|nr:alpha-galactosidase [Oscillospiraceae bacterium]